MSRCFSFPPPEYTLSRTSMLYLFDTIKLLKQKEKKAREQYKKKKQSRRDQKNIQSDDHIAHNNVEIIDKFEGISNVTKENGQLVPSSSSDSTNTTNNRQFPYLPLNMDCSNDLEYGSENSVIVSFDELVGNCRSTTPQVMMRDYLSFDVDIGWLCDQFKKPAVTVDDDLDWLLQKPNVSAEKRRKILNDGVSCLTSLALTQQQPFALPFTVLF